MDYDDIATVGEIMRRAGMRCTNRRLLLGFLANVCNHERDYQIALRLAKQKLCPQPNPTDARKKLVAEADRLVATLSRPRLPKNKEAIHG